MCKNRVYTRCLPNHHYPMPVIPAPRLLRFRCVFIAVSLALLLLGAAALAQGPHALANLDRNGNGLYEPAERKALLDLLLKQYPEMWERLEASAVVVGKAASKDPLDFRDGTKPAAPGAPRISRQSNPFDLNNDGQVTIEEEAADRPPLAFLVPQRVIESPTKIPWALDLFAEWISTAYLQEDAAAGAVSRHVPRGTVPTNAEQNDPLRQPQKSAAGAGIAFAADSGQFLSMAGERDARWNYRWCILTFRIDANSGTGRDTVLLDLNRGKGSNTSSPKIWFSKETGLNIQFVGLNKGGLDKRVMRTRDLATDGKRWNVLVCGIRYGQMFASVNGVPLATETRQPPRFSGEWPLETTTFLGDDRNQQNAAWAYDALVFGLTEPSEAMVRKMTGWAAHRLGFQNSLPDGHPYKVQRPVLDAEDFPDRYIHDDAAWNAWGQALKTNRAADRANAGGPRVEPQGFQRVFYDDFRAYRIAPSTSGEADLWAGPGFNIAVGGDAALVTPGKEPNTYPHDPDQQTQTLALVRQSNQRWRGSAIYSVNDLGHGHVWRGPKIFRIRCMFPKADQKSLAGGLFPAFWSYAPENILWRTSNRIENDWFEFDGQNGAWLNGLSTHYHYAYLQKNIFARHPGSYQRYKAYGGELSEAKSKIPGGLFVWDGNFHTWEFVIDQDTTYVNVTLPQQDGTDRWVEIFRCPTPQVYLEPLDLQLNYALKGNHGVPKDGQRQDFVIDSIEVLQKASAIAAVPKPFTARPVLTGTNAAGRTITCQPRLQGISDVRYFWFADGYPLTYGPDNSYTLTAAEAGKRIQCLVKAVGARNAPEAWSAPLP